MFNIFQKHFRPFSSIENPMKEMNGIPFKYSELLLACGGRTYEKGLYTIHTFENSNKWTNLLKRYFPKLSFDFISFGHDWLGRQFCVPVGIGEYILVFDPSNQEELHMDTNLIDFHDSFLVSNKAEFFISEYFDQILAYLGIQAVEHDKCLGLKTSLFLGGNEELSNYSLYDIEMYWDFENQIFNQISRLPPGSSIGKVTINPFNNNKFD